MQGLPVIKANISEYMLRSKVIIAAHPNGKSIRA